LREDFSERGDGSILLAQLSEMLICSRAEMENTNVDAKKREISRSDKVGVLQGIKTGHEKAAEIYGELCLIEKVQVGHLISSENSQDFRTYFTTIILGLRIFHSIGPSES
jgi:hypothetical protein